MLLEQCGALLHLTSSRSSGLGDCTEHILPADNHADDIGDWNHRLGAFPAFHRSPVATHAGELVTLLLANLVLLCTHCSDAHVQACASK